MRVVEYSVMLNNDTISLQYPHWQNDTFIKAAGSDLDGSLLPLLFPPVQLNLTYRTFRSLPRKFEFVRYKDCAGSPDSTFSDSMITATPSYYSNTSCVDRRSGQGLSGNDFPRKYLRLPERDPSCAQFEYFPSCACNYTWRDPMQVTSSLISFSRTWSGYQIDFFSKGHA